MPEKGTKEYALLLKETLGKSASNDFNYKEHIAFSRKPKDYPDWLSNVYDINERWLEENKVNTSKSFQNNYEEYDFFRRIDGSIEIKTENGFDDITGIPRLHFADRDISPIAEIETTFDLVKDKDDLSGQIFRIYSAAFDRFPDSDGLEYWINKTKSGENNKQQVANSFLNSKEFSEKYGEDISNEQFINNLYQNILNRQSDPEGFNYWVGQLNNGIEERSEILLGFSESTENQLIFSEVTGLY